MEMPAKVLVVEDEALISMYIEDILLDAGFEVVTAFNADVAIPILEQDRSIRVVVTDVDMPGSMDGLRLAAVIQERWPPTVLVVASGKHRPTSKELPAGAVFLSKPFLGKDLLKLIDRLAA